MQRPPEPSATLDAARATHALVLLSGGIDSAALLRLALAKGLDVQALHVGYGQAAASAELAAASGITAEAGVPLIAVNYRGKAPGSGEIRGRNALLLQVALFEFPWTTGLVLLGIHAGTDYRDCTTDFVAQMQNVYALHTNGQIEVEAPFLDLLKGDVVRLAYELGVPIAVTHSCEASDNPCGRCQSCLDRSRLLLELANAHA